MEHCDNNARHSIPDFNSDAVQKRLGPSAMRIFRKMIEIWTITVEDALLLLGLQDDQILRCNPENFQLDRDTLMRISYLTGIFSPQFLVQPPASGSVDQPAQYECQLRWSNPLALHDRWRAASNADCSQAVGC